MGDLAEQMPEEQFSEREIEILGLLAERFSNREIAQKLYLSLETVKWYNKQIYSKLGVRSRTQAVARAGELGLLDQEEKIEQPSPVDIHLPAQLTSFVGREEEIRAIRELLGQARLVTLTGAGGSGKTRLSLKVGSTTAAQYRDGVVFVPLSAINNPVMVANAIARETGVIEQSVYPLIDMLKYYFRPKEMLLILDNFEHLLPAVSLITELLAVAPELTILVTSREALRIRGEHEYLVPPMTLGDTVSTTELAKSEAVMLFAQRARGAVADFSLTDENTADIAAICRRLDGLPLAIELAAARVKLFSPAQLLARLESPLHLLTRGPRDMPERQRTLRATIEWSYDLLDETEKRLFARLSVFNDGRSLEAVEAVCEAGLYGDPLTSLESLLNKSLLFQQKGAGGIPRFFMLRTIQEFAWEQLFVSGEADKLRNRHLEYFVGLVERMEPGFRRHDQLLLLDQTDTEMGNLRTAFDWAMATDQVEAAARLFSSIDYYFRYKDGFAEGARWAMDIHPRMEEISRPYRIRFILAVVRLRWKSRENEFVKSMTQEGIDLALQDGDRHNLAWLLLQSVFTTIGNLKNRDTYENALRHCEESISIFQEFEDKTGIAYALNIQGELMREVGDFEGARESYEASMAMSIEIGEIYRQRLMLTNLAFICYHQGDYKRAEELLREFLSQEFDSGMRTWKISGLAFLAGPLLKMGYPEKATRLLGASKALSEAMGFPHDISDQIEIDLYLSEVKAALDEETFAKAWAEGRSMTLEEALALGMED